jgi:hypothetical protein
VNALREALRLVGEQQLRGRRLVRAVIAVATDVVELLPETGPGLPEQGLDLRGQGVQIGA